MTEPKEDSVDKTKIIERIADLSGLLGMIPSDDTIAVNDPVTHNPSVAKRMLRNEA